MHRLIETLLRFRALMLLLMLIWLAAGIYFFFQLDIEAYPDPSQPLVEFITQTPSWSAEEMEQQVTVPVETGRCEIVFQLWQRLLLGSPGSPEPLTVNHASFEPHSATLAFHSGWKPNSAFSGRERYDSKRRLHDLSRRRPALYPSKIQRSKQGSCRHDTGGPARYRAKCATARGLSL